MQADRKLWRTTDNRLVEDGDPDAAILAYNEGDDLSPADAAAMEGQKSAKTEAKAAEQPANKAAERPANKGTQR